MLAARLSSLLLLVACGKGEPAPERMPADPAAAAKAGSATALTFAWPAPATVKVTEKAHKKGKDATMRYTLAITREPDGGLQVAYRDFEFVELAGVDLADPEIKKQLAPALALAAAIPPLKIAADGSFRDVVALDSVVDKLLETGMKSGGISPAEAEQMRTAMKSPAMMEILRDRIADTWMAWVGLWLAGPLPGPGQSRAVTSDGASGTVRNLGAGQRGLRLGAEIEVSGDAIGTLLTTLLGDEADDGSIEGASKRSTIEVELDPATMKPFSASYEYRMKATVDGSPIEAFERHQYQFVWQ